MDRFQMLTISTRCYFLSFLVLMVCLLYSCHKEKPVVMRPPVDVAVEKIERQTIPAIFEYVGVVQSSHEVEIRARVTGYLDTIAYIEGTEVQKGDLLFQLDPRPFQAALAQAQAQLAGEESILWQAQRAVKRFTPLYEQKAASQRDLDNALASQMSAEANVMAAKAKLADAEINLSYTTIRSPVSGLASMAKYRVGSLISPGQDMLTTVSVVDPIWVLFSVSEQDLLRSVNEVRKGRMVFPKNNQFTVELILADGTIFPEQGLVNFTSPAYSQKTGTMTIRAVLPNPQDLLRPGQFVRVRIHGAVRPNAIAIPQSAVQQGQNGSFVFVVNAKNQAEARPIVPGPWSQGNWIIWEGLEPGDKVIINGVNKVLPGSPVKIIKEIVGPPIEDQKQPQQQTGTTNL